MKKTILTIVGLLSLGLVSHAQTYVLDKKIPLTGDGGYDYVSIDKVNNKLYASHGTMVNVVDLATEQQVGVIEGMKGVHGIAIANKSNRGFISDGRANAVVAFDLKTFKIIATIPVDAKGPMVLFTTPIQTVYFALTAKAITRQLLTPKH